MKSSLVFAKARNIIEALLFAASEPLSAKQIRGIVDLPEESIEAVLMELEQDYGGRGIRIFKIAHGYILGTDPECAQYLETLRNFPEETRLSKPALETLAIIAYKQPTTRPEVERIRGVFSDGVIETLLNKKLIKECGRSDTPGRPILYATTEEFLKHFGLKDVSELPSILLPLPA